MFQTIVCFSFGVVSVISQPTFPQGIGVILKNLEDEELTDDLREAAYATMRSKVLRLKFLGGCPRDMTGDCPKEWTPVEGGACAPPAGYDGLCGNIVFSKP